MLGSRYQKADTYEGCGLRAPGSSFSGDDSGSFKVLILLLYSEDGSPGWVSGFPTREWVLSNGCG